MKYFRLLAAVGLLVGFVLPAKVSAAPPAVFLQGGNSFGENATLGTNDNFALIFKTGNLEAMRIDTEGNVGIGTANPQAQLHIKGEGNFLFESYGDFILQQADENNPGVNLQFRDHTGATRGQISLENNLNDDTLDGLYFVSVSSSRGIAINDLTGNTSIGAPGNYPNPEGTLQIANGYHNPSTLYIGASENSVNLNGDGQSPGCLVLGDSDGVGVTYVTANDGVLSASTTKPSICD